MMYGYDRGSILLSLYSVERLRGRRGLNGKRFMEGSQKVHGRCTKAHGGLTKGSWKVHEGSWRAHKRFMEGARRLMEGSQKVHEGPWRAHKRFMEGARRFMEFSRRVHGRLTKVHEEFTIQCGLNESYADQLRKFIFAHTYVLRRICAYIHEPLFLLTSMQFSLVFSCLRFCSNRACSCESLFELLNTDQPRGILHF